MADHPSGYEKRDTSIRSIVVAALVTVVALVIAIIILYDYFIATKEAVIYDQSLRPESEELIKVRQAEDSVLNSYELIDPEQRTYRVPIARAMELLAAESAGTTPQN
jgi:hypothetical protein